MAGALIMLIDLGKALYKDWLITWWYSSTIFWCCFVYILDINECADNPCGDADSGTCVDGINTFHCQCNEGYTPPLCIKGKTWYEVNFTGKNIIWTYKPHTTQLPWVEFVFKVVKYDMNFTEKFVVWT